MCAYRWQKRVLLCATAVGSERGLALVCACAVPGLHGAAATWPGAQAHLRALLPGRISSCPSLCLDFPLNSSRESNEALNKENPPHYMVTGENGANPLAFVKSSLFLCLFVAANGVSPTHSLPPVSELLTLSPGSSLPCSFHH